MIRSKLVARFSSLLQTALAVRLRVVAVRALLKSLAGIEESVLLDQGERGCPRVRRILTDKDTTQNRFYELFGLDSYARSADRRIG